MIENRVISLVIPLFFWVIILGLDALQIGVSQVNIVVVTNAFKFERIIWVDIELSDREVEYHSLLLGSTNVEG